MNIGERIKKIRKELNMTQAEFATRIGSVQNTVTGYESGRRNPSSLVLALICREFNIREDWLRNGDGEMFLPVTEDEYIKTAASFSDDPLVRNFVIKYSKLDAVGKKLLYDFLLDLTDSMREQE